MPIAAIWLMPTTPDMVNTAMRPDTQVARCFFRHGAIEALWNFYTKSMSSNGFKVYRRTFGVSRPANADHRRLRVIFGLRLYATQNPDNELFQLCGFELG
jgi:hypothetical protein